MTDKPTTDPGLPGLAALDPDRMRRQGVRGGGALTVVAAAIALLFDVRVAAGILLGGIAGTLGFGLLARRLAAAAGQPPSRLAIELYRGVMGRLGLYAAALVAAYFIDRVGLRGLLGGAAGLLLMHAVVLFLGISGARALRPGPGK